MILRKYRLHYYSKIHKKTQYVNSDREKINASIFQKNLVN